MKNPLILVFVLFFVVVNSSLNAFKEEAENDEDGFLIIKDANGNDVTCGVERWAIKTCIDPDTVLVDFTNIVQSSITYQRSLPTQTYLPPYNRLPLEDTVYTLDCKLLQYKLETDGDVHCVIANIATGETMIREICDPSCPGISSTSRYEELTVLRNWFVTNFNPTTSWQYPNVNVRIVGVGFFDFLHGQIGIPPNGREIHPILSMMIITGIEPISNETPEEFKLFQNYPNPFNPSTIIKFDIGPPLIPILTKEGEGVVLKIYDLLGREATTLLNRKLQPGSYEVTWNASQYPSGIYFYVLTAGEFKEAKKLILLK